MDRSEPARGRPTREGKPEMGQPLFQEPPAPQSEPPVGDPPKDSTPAPSPTPPKEDKGPAGGEKAILADLAKERDARKALEAKLTAMGQALGVEPAKSTGKTDVEALAERIAAQEKRAAEAELRAVRLEVAAEKGLTPAQAARLSGSSREDLAKDADELKALFPASNGTGTPRPDPTQGARSGAGELEAALKAAQAKGDAKESIRIKQLIAAQKSK